MHLLGKEITNRGGIQWMRVPNGTICLSVLILFLGCSSETEQSKPTALNAALGAPKETTQHASSAEGSADQGRERIREAISRFELGELDAALSLVLAELVANPNEPQALLLILENEMQEVNSLLFWELKLIVETSFQFLLQDNLTLHIAKK